MKIRGKILSVFGLLSFSFSAAAFVCPTVKDLNSNPQFLVNGERVGMFTVDIYGNSRITYYNELYRVLIDNPGLTCSYRALTPEGRDNWVFIRAPGLYKPAHPEYWERNYYCEHGILLCEVFDQ